MRINKCKISVHIICMVFLLTGLFLPCEAQEKYDIIIKNTKIVDGTGSPGYHGDIAIKSKKIELLGTVKGDAKIIFRSLNRFFISKVNLDLISQTRLTSDKLAERIRSFTSLRSSFSKK